MNTAGDAAEQVVRLSIEGAEFAAKIAGQGAKEIATFLVAALQGAKRTKGKTRLASLLKSGKELKVFSLSESDLKKFAQEAKKVFDISQTSAEATKTEAAPRDIRTIGVIPVVWLALLTAPAISGGLVEIIKYLSEAFEHPFAIKWCSASIKTVLIFIAIYAMGIGIYLSSAHNYRKREEHGSAKWGDARAISKKYKAQGNENKILTQNVSIGLAGLSALMTTTVPAMEETIKQLKVKAPWCKTVVGGAVLTQEYADKIGADKYAKDAMEAVRYAENVIGGKV